MIHRVPIKTRSRLPIGCPAASAARSHTAPAAVLGALLVSACMVSGMDNDVGPAGNGTETQAAALPIRAQSPKLREGQPRKLPEGYRPGADVQPAPIAVEWDDTSGGEDVGALRVILKNNTAHQVSVSLDLSANDPYGDAASRFVGLRTLAAHASEPVTIEVAELPIQSTVLATSVQLLATVATDQETPATASAAEQPAFRKFTPPRYVTFNQDWSRAAVRSLPEQAKTNGAMSDPLAQQAKVRHLDAETGKMEAVAHSASTVVSIGPVMGGRDTPRKWHAAAAAKAVRNPEATE